MPEPQPPPALSPDGLARAKAVANRIPDGGLFSEKSWRISPTPIPIPASTAGRLEKLGQVFLSFYRACNKLYLASSEGSAPEWIARWLDAGKPRHLVEFARSKKMRAQIPKLIRPDLLLDGEKLSLCELDSVPGGIGATAWMQETYSQLGAALLGGATGMRDGWRSILPEGVVMVSHEAQDYLPEMRWLNPDGGSTQVVEAESHQLDGRPAYRFFEAFDLPNLPLSAAWMEALSQGAPMTPPLKPYLEEKLWMGLFWIPLLKDYWRVELGAGYDSILRELIPYTWVLTPDTLPPHAVIPRLEISDWQQLATFSQKARRLVVKISGFSPQAWGSRGVWFGHDLPSGEWAQVISDSLSSFPTSPRILQEFADSTAQQVEYWDTDSDTLKSFHARVRLCPYYFVQGDKTQLGGVLATAVPTDKKAIHGMRDAVLAPV